MTNESTALEARSEEAGRDSKQLLDGALLGVLAEYKGPRPTYYLKNFIRHKFKGLRTPEVRRALFRMEKRGEVERTTNPYGGGNDLWWRLPSNYY